MSEGPSPADERLARIERELGELRAAIGALGEGLAEQAPLAPRGGRGALRRLALASWAAGLVALAAGSWIAGVEAARDPRANVCAGREAHRYDECLVTPPAPTSDSWLELLRRRLVGPPVDPERDVPRLHTERYRSSARTLAGLAAAWTILVAALHGVLAWVLGGLAAPGRRRRAARGRSRGAGRDAAGRLGR